LLIHTVRCAPSQVASVLTASTIEVVLVDARTDLLAARVLCQLLNAAATPAPVIAVLTEAGLAAVNSGWGVDEILLSGAGAAEIDVRLRLLVGRRRGMDDRKDVATVSLGALVMNEGAHTALLHGRPLLLTYKEFELLKHLARHPGRVFTRGQLLHEVWGYDYFGGTRTIDVHIRRLRAKLGDYQFLIGTVRNVGYQAVRRNAGTPASGPGPHRGGMHVGVRAPSPPATITPGPPPTSPPWSPPATAA
jgi:DNA-binding response OmpR family regulator